MKRDIYREVTDRITAELEQGVRPWIKPWSADNAAACVTRPLRHNGEPYQGINILLLWGAAMGGGFASPYWLTFNQAKSSARMSVRARKVPPSSTRTRSPGPRKTRTARKSRARSPS